MADSSSDGLGSVVYHVIRERIVLGQLRPNELISEAELAQELHVSRTPVREALQRLADERLIRSHKRRWIVYQHTVEEISEIYEVRTALESYAARLAAARISDETLAVLDDQVNSRPLCMDHGDDVMVKTNNLFHATIVRACGNEQLQAFVEESHRYYFNSQVALLYREADIRKSQAQYVALLEALKSRNPDAAEAIAREHINHALGIIRSRLMAPYAQMPTISLRPVAEGNPSPER